ncbi:hypothetical protein OAI36_01770 [Alphaproteobacteria bacterium]|nr:hypothetical protein [Alphaproteobacteria bacterium]
MTFHHHIEEMMSAPYRYMKNFTGDYIDLSGRKSQKTYSIYVIDLEVKVETELDPLGGEDIQRFPSKCRDGALSCSC